MVGPVTSVLYETQPPCGGGKVPLSSTRATCRQQMTRTFLHVALQHGSVSEDERVEDGLASGVKGPMQADVTAGLSAAVVLAINVAMDPGQQQVQTGSYGAVWVSLGGGRGASN